MRSGVDNRGPSKGGGGSRGHLSLFLLLHLRDTFSSLFVGLFFFTEREKKKKQRPRNGRADVAHDQFAVKTLVSIWFHFPLDVALPDAIYSARYRLVKRLSGWFAGAPQSRNGVERSGQSGLRQGRRRARLFFFSFHWTNYHLRSRSRGASRYGYQTKGERRGRYLIHVTFRTVK